MADIDQQFNVLAEKLQALSKRMAALQRENDSLRDALQKARDEESSAKAAVEALHQQMTVLKFAAVQMSERDKQAFDREIARYIRQIDKTIAHLSQ